MLVELYGLWTGVLETGELRRGGGQLLLPLFNEISTKVLKNKVSLIYFEDRSDSEIHFEQFYREGA